MTEPRRVPLVQLPTPLHRLDRLSEELGIDLWIKRDDLTGFAFGGNKGRKLEYLMGEALDRKAAVVVTCGATQSNFVRQLGAACSKLGLRCAAVVMDLPFEPEYGKPSVVPLDEKGANYLLDTVLGVEFWRFPDASWDDLFGLAEKVAAELESGGATVYRVPVGGSSPLGAYGFAKAAEEVARQAPAFDRIVTASSSGSTQAGLAWGFHGSSTRVTGISCDPEPDLLDTMAELCAGLDELTGERKGVAKIEFDLRFDWVGAGYGVPSDASVAAIRRLAAAEGVFVDPIYSGKAFAGLLDLAASGEVAGRVLFWHTGGTPTVFATRQLSGSSP